MSNLLQDVPFLKKKIVKDNSCVYQLSYFFVHRNILSQPLGFVISNYRLLVSLCCYHYDVKKN